MGLRQLLQFKVRKYLTGSGNHKETETRKMQSWMVPISHGYHVVEDQSFWGRTDDHEESNSDQVMVQRETIEDVELWFFGLFDARIADGVTKYMQSHFFGKMPKQYEMRRKCKEIIKKAHVNARASISESDQVAGEKNKVGSASLIVMNGEKLVMSNMGDYRAVLCKDGTAHQIIKGQNIITKKHWSRKLIPGAFRLHKMHILAFDTGDSEEAKHSEIFVANDKIDEDTEFVILASKGIWEVMKNQEAVNLIMHIENAQEAAECLAKEALTRMSRGNISCLIVRFD